MVCERVYIYIYTYDGVVGDGVCVCVCSKERMYACMLYISRLSCVIVCVLCVYIEYIIYSLYVSYNRVAICGVYMRKSGT